MSSEGGKTDPRVAELTRAIDLGFAALQFQKSDIGRILADRADEARIELVKELIEMPRQAILAGADIDVRMKLKAIDFWQDELVMLVNAGEVAQQQLRGIEFEGDQP